MPSCPVINFAINIRLIIIVDLLVSSISMFRPPNMLHYLADNHYHRSFIINTRMCDAFSNVQPPWNSHPPRSPAGNRYYPDNKLDRKLKKWQFRFHLALNVARAFRIRRPDLRRSSNCTVIVRNLQESLEKCLKIIIIINKNTFLFYSLYYVTSRIQSVENKYDI